LKRISASTKIYLLLVLALGISNAIQVLLPSYQNSLPLGTVLPTSIPVLALINAGIAIVLYGGLGFAGLILSRKLGFADIIDSAVSNRQRFISPAVIGVLAGVIIIIGDLIFAPFNGIGSFPHPAFPSSFFASLSAGIGEELLFRLFFISFWTWLISSVILRGRGKEQTFWIVTSFSALAFALGHIPSLMILAGFSSVDQIPVLLIIEIILLNSTISIPAAYYLRKWGFLAAVGMHFWADIIWHVIWGLF
jgi:hypothetical protein